MPAVVDFIKEAVRDGSLKPDELFSALPVEYRDHITVLYLKTLDSEDILDLLCFLRVKNVSVLCFLKTFTNSGV